VLLVAALGDAIAAFAFRSPSGVRPRRPFDVRRHRRDKALVAGASERRVCESWEYAGSADAALNQLDREYDTWLAGVRDLGEEGLTRPCGPTENDWADEPVARLILHIHRELIHHGAEVACLRDLYAHADGRRLS